MNKSNLELLEQIKVKLESTSSSNHMEALQSLKELPMKKGLTEFYISLLDHKVWKVRKGAAARLSAEIGISFVHLLPHLNSPSQHIRYWIIQILPSAGKKAVKHLVEAYSTYQEDEKLFLLEALQKIEDPSSISFALERLNDSQWSIRKEASEILLHLKSKAVPALKEAIRNGTDDQRFWSFKVLGKMSGLNALETFTNILFSEDYEEKIRSYALTGIQEIESKKTIPVLIKTLESDSWTLRAQAAKILINHNHEPHRELIRAMLGGNRTLKYWGHQILKSITREKHLGLLEVFLDSDDFDLRFQAISILSQVPSRAAVQILMKCLDSSTWYIRKHSSDAIIQVGKVALEPLLEESRNANEEKLFWICKILGRLEHPGALPGLEKLLDHNNKEIRLWAMDSIQRVGGLRAVQIMIEAFQNQYWIVRSRASEALLSLGILSMPELFEGVLGDSESTLYWCSKTIEDSTYYGAKSILKFLLDSNERDSREIINRLAQLNENALQEVLSHESLKPRDILERLKNKENIRAAYRTSSPENHSEASNLEFSFFQQSEFPYEVRQRFDDLIDEFISMSGQTLHLKPGRVPLVRINGSLTDCSGKKLDSQTIQEFLAPYMHEDSIRIFHQEGFVEITIPYKTDGRFRVHISKEARGVEAVMHYGPSTVPNFESLGLPLEFFSHISRLPRGLVLVCGPAGAGKSTAISSLISHINSSYVKNILCIQERVDFLFEGERSIVSQKLVGRDIGSFEKAVESFTQGDVDVAYFSQVPVYPQLENLLHQASSRSLVFLECNASNSKEALEKLLLLFPEAQRKVYERLLQGALQACVFMRLLKSSDESGHIPALEYFLNNSRISRCLEIENLGDLSNVLKTSKQEFFMSMDDYLLELASQQKITYQEAIRFMEDKSRISVDQIW